MKIEISKKDLRTISTILAEKAHQMRKKGVVWRRDNDEHLSCVDIGNIANKLLKPLGEEWLFKFNPSK